MSLALRLSECTVEVVSHVLFFFKRLSPLAFFKIFLKKSVIIIREKLLLKNLKFYKICLQYQYKLLWGLSHIKSLLSMLVGYADFLLQYLGWRILGSEWTTIFHYCRWLFYFCIMPIKKNWYSKVIRWSYQTIFFFQMMGQ